MDFHIDPFPLDPPPRQIVPQAGVPARAGDTLIGVLVDRSGSMSDHLEGMQGGLNRFLVEQASLSGGAAVMLAQFDDSYEMVWTLQSLVKGRRYQLKPRGGTALYDSMGQFIGDVADTLAEEDSYRPVIICVVTDGMDNQSREWTKAALTERISFWREHYGWKFVFIGANLDAVRVAGDFGIPPELALTFDTAHADASYSVLSKTVAALRAGDSSGFTDADRRKAIGR